MPVNDKLSTDSSMSVTVVDVLLLRSEAFGICEMMYDNKFGTLMGSAHIHCERSEEGVVYDVVSDTDTSLPVRPSFPSITPRLLRSVISMIPLQATIVAITIRPIPELLNRRMLVPLAPTV